VTVLPTREMTKRKQVEEIPLPRGPYAISADVVAADQRRRLLDALPLVVAEHGFEGTTVDRIVKAAQVRRNSFYEQFADKRDCFTAAYEIAQERLLGVLTYQCYARATLADRLRHALESGLSRLAADRGLTRLIVVEAPAAGGEISARHHEWLDRYSRLLRFAAIDSPEIAGPSAAVEPAVVGGILSRVKQMVLAGEAEALARLRPELVQFVQSFYAPLGVVPAAALATRAGRNGQAEPQPQSSEPTSVLEPA
jgi:AcrR family transcriptional regulator